MITILFQNKCFKKWKSKQPIWPLPMHPYIYVSGSVGPLHQQVHILWPVTWQLKLLLPQQELITFINPQTGTKSVIGEKRNTWKMKKKETYNSISKSTNHTDFTST